MTRESPITPAQIRAARALLNWSQEQLANAAAVGLSTVRDYENERRGGDFNGLKAIRRALENHDVAFLASEGDFGPGVRLVARKPNVLLRPRKLGRWDGLLIPVEWRGQEIEIYLPHNLLDDIGHFTGTQSAEDYIELFDQHRSAILGKAAAAIDAGRVTSDKRVHLGNDDFPELLR